MKFKYYLRGAGVGVIVTTLIFTVALLRYQPALSADEIRQQAEKLGMVMPEESASGDAKKSEDDQRREESASDQKEEDVPNSQKDTQQETKTDGEKSDEKTQDQTASQEEKKKTDEPEKQEEPVTIRFVVRGGQFSDVVSNNLAEKGLVPDGETYNKWLMRHHYDQDILPGVYYIKSDATYKEIAEMITTEQE